MAQTSSIREKAETYLQATENADWEGVVDMLYPKLFTLSPREAMINTFKNMEGEGMKIRIHDTAISSISDINTYEEEQYAFVKYSMIMDMQLTGEAFQEESIIGMLKNQFEGTYGAENVRFEQESNTFVINADNTMIALAPKNSTDWKFLEYKVEMEPMLTQILGEGVVARLKE